ncbi:uncharacterized protein YjgD (DUF1641 family) [Pseudomonas duriflava]|uniref:Uncharacterized protein YjgD (DUF1641 family) n=1 Tax=Pseudomonas duriflava TaxID=459528 RepID=A0A562PXW5_9PSED|nr:DUF1641 domain-containing protein [Pseudomonas duriflava]TWI49244.1 uncharacterized protein YjgD (DUF1641 family) [Pseudomonas duriflava]
MAERISYDVKPPKIGPDAHEELERLLQTLHEHGILRFANDLAAANTHVAKVLVDGLNKEGTLNAIQNISILGMALSRIPPEQFYKVAFALKDAFTHVSTYKLEEKGTEAPGVTGAYKMLHDDALWQAITPIIEGLKIFAERLDKEVDKPISEFTGKPSSA